MARVLFVVLVIAVTVFALADWARADPDAMPGGLPKPLWLPLLLIVPVFGPLVWVVTRYVARAERQQSAGPRAAPAEPVPPDDDPEFLFRVERDIRRRRKDERKHGRGAKGPHPKGTRPSGDEDGHGGTGDDADRGDSGSPHRS